jgi:hypothetical protein
MPYHAPKPVPAKEQQTTSVEKLDAIRPSRYCPNRKKNASCGKTPRMPLITCLPNRGPSTPQMAQTRNDLARGMIGSIPKPIGVIAEFAFSEADDEW